MFWHDWHPMRTFGPGHTPPSLVPFPQGGPPMAPPVCMPHPSFFYPPPYYPSYFPNPLPPPVFVNPIYPPFAPLVTPASLMPHQNLNFPPACMPEEGPPVFVGFANLPVAVETSRRRGSKKRVGSRHSRTKMWLDNILDDVFKNVDFTAADGEIVDMLDSYLHKFEGKTEISEILSQPDLPPPATNPSRKRNRPSHNNTSESFDVPQKRSRPQLF
ncbi:hypothetical protein DNTS_027238 [Danionella cerebrum]|uniref:Uncharacterized protein n=1 Tax=Danionella cerebrum TaxID=2873325 RepID=A0A553NAJ1_9TELE|nr:hypothetical protein DNTS_027238 [Danionella translucida]